MNRRTGLDASISAGNGRTLASARTRTPLVRALPNSSSMPALSSVPEDNSPLTSYSSLFGAKPNPFGASTTTANTGGGGGLFGAASQTTPAFGGTGGFGNANNTTSGFSFGQSKPAAFGAGATGGSLFSSGQATANPFGNTSSSPFGAGSGTALSPQPVPPSDGTASTPFAVTVEKDTPTSSQSNAYQSITFQQPYQKYSFEELRLADYNAGRRYGTGGFGGSSTFGGGFGAQSGGFGTNSGTTGGLFSNNQQSSASGFSTNTATTGFGGGGLFGAQSAKPAGGLFGQQTPAAGSSIFGNTNTTSNPFGQQPASAAPSTGLFGGTSGSLFGNNQTKPATGGFSFGPAATNTAPAGGNSIFGQAQPQQPANTGFGGFGAAQTQAKPSIFGNTGGSFGSASTQGQTSSIFSTSNTGGGGLFGQNQNANNDANKPAGGGLFGGGFGNNTSNTGSSLFPNQATQTQGNSLFSNTSNNNTSGNFSFNQPQKSLFPTTQTGGGLFNNSAPSNGLFSSTNQSGSMFGNSMNNSQQQQQQNTPKTASALDQSAYGQSSIWTGLPAATPQNSTPLVTPLRAAQNLKDSKSRPPPSLKLNQSRYMTPKQKVGYGFTYSTYGTPNSAASTPGTGGVFRGGFAGSLGRSSLGKSFSASNLHQQYSNNADSVMSPGAMTPKIANFSTGSMRRLKIDHTLRQDLFSPRLPALTAPNGTSSSNTPTQNSNTPPAIENGERPTATEQPRQQPKKRVSFDRETTGGGLNGQSGALVRTEEEVESPLEEPQPRITRGRPSTKPTNGEMEQVRGNELAVVPEDRVSDNETSMRLPTDVTPTPDPEPGNYWMKPTRSELQKLPRDKLKSFAGLQVGRRGCGFVTFTGAVDLTTINMDDIFDKIVEIRVRSITVYPEASSKPPMGKGLNVPSTLFIENSWPRSRNKPSAATSGPVFDKHIQRLRRMAGTEFLNYDVKTGVWTFKVPHYTRYGLDYDDDEDLGDSVMGLPSREDSLEAQTPDEMDVETPDDSDPDDTFMGKQKTVPGGFGRSSVIPYDVEEHDSDDETPLPSDDEASVEDVDMVGSYPPPERQITPEATPAPALKASFRPWGTPGRPLLDLDGDWAEQLQRTISPRKQNRDALREVQSKVLLDRAYEPIQPQRAAEEKKEFRTSIDVMNSLFGKHQQRQKNATNGRKINQGQNTDFEV
jgi:nuclear pore complex protein Nup98-Nup96